MIERNRVYCSDALALLRRMDEGSVNCVVTSPPYWGLRDYGVTGQYGMEATPAEFVQHLVELFREVSRVLRDDGTVWLNLGDSYANDTKWGGQTGGKHATGLHGGTSIGRNRTNTGLPSKSLIGIPWRVAFALQDDGWILRSDIIWHKPNPMPESVTDRPTRAHEYIFLLTKSPTYWYDAAAIREPAKEVSIARAARGVSDTNKNVNGAPGQPPHSIHQPRLRDKQRGHSRRHAGFNERWDAMPKEEQMAFGANKRTVWSVATVPFPGAHFATFPPELIRPCILAGCPEKTCAVCGAPWERVVERESTWQDRRAAGATAGNVGVSDSYQNGVHGRGLSHDLGPKSVLDLGLQPTCDCNAGTVPGVVYDPFMGSGTVALVARSLGRQFIGSEINPDYVAMAEDRLRLPFAPRAVAAENDVSDLPLFAANGGSK